MENVQNPSLTIDVAADVPIVQQVVNGLRRMLVAGELAPGDTLPSSRALGRDLGVHFNTVAQAYRELEAEGWLLLKRRAGTVVRDRATPRLDASRADALAGRFTEDLRDLCARYAALGLDRDAIDAALRRLIDDRRTST
jgi:DNA-binding transcriptional regulator YhcF (GntR family)